MRPTWANLKVLHDACAAAAGPKLAGALSPLAGYCDAAAEVVRGLHGGAILTGTVEGCQHFWNRLPDGRDVDLTSCQFGGDGLRPLKRGRLMRPQSKCVSLRGFVFGLKVGVALAREGVPCLT
jgi:hypothetical protein